MRLHDRLRAALGFRTAARPHTGPRPLSVESLEDRSLPSVLSGVGVVGDSYTRDRGGNNWPEQLAVLRNLNFGPTTPIDPAVNWYRHGYMFDGTPTTMLEPGGPVDQLVARIQAGEVTLVYLDGIGRNFAAAYVDIYQGTLAGADLDAFIGGQLALVRTAYERLTAAGPVKVVLEDVGDIGRAPFLATNPGLTDPQKRARFVAAIQSANARLQDMADQWQVPVVSQFGWFNRVMDAAPLTVAGLVVDNSPTYPGPAFSNYVTDPLMVFYEAQHAGPVVQGLKANVVLDAVRQAYGEDVAPLSDQEIVRYAFGQARQMPPPLTGTTYFPVDGLVKYNRPPVAVGDRATTRTGTPVTIPVLANDSDPNGDRLSVVSVSTPAHGSVAVNADGTLTYRPAAGFAGGTDTFTYTISDGRYRTGTATVTVTVVQTVAIDARPVINLADNGVLAVTLFSSAQFDATRVAIDSVRFAGAAASGFTLSDVNGDGRPDLVLRFRTQDTRLRAVYEQLLRDDLNADGVLDSTRQTATVSLTGLTLDGLSFAGDDTVDLFLSGRSLRELLDTLVARGPL